MCTVVHFNNFHAFHRSATPSQEKNLIRLILLRCSKIIGQNVPISYMILHDFVRFCKILLASYNILLQMLLIRLLDKMFQNLIRSYKIFLLGTEKLR